MTEKNKMGLFESLLGILAGSRQAQEQAQALQTMSDYITQQSADQAHQIIEQMQRGFLMTDILIGLVGLVLLIVHLVQGHKLDQLQRDIREMQFRQLEDSPENVRPLKNRRFS